MAGCDDDKKPQPDPSLVYFLVTERSPDKGETFILPLKDPADIAEARDLIESDEDKIVLARITTNDSDNYSLNKDINNKRTWSWHISQFDGFADFSIEIYDGWPSYVEENYEEWVANTKGSGTHGIIGFWNYSISREVSVSELYGD